MPGGIWIVLVLLVELALQNASSATTVYNKERPTIVLPKESEVNHTRFLLFTRERPSIRHIIEVNNIRSVESSSFKSTRETKIIVHGFIHSPDNTNWMESMKTALLRNGDYNVIIVDWGDINRGIYHRVVPKTRLVADETELLIDYLGKTRGLRPESIHIIGHSLGAHIAGFTGKRIKQKGRLLGRITGLDPAGPHFNGNPPVDRLDRRDADFVDVIHTDIHRFGMLEAVGHVDFYPNNGQGHPGCTGLIPKVSCNHQRSVDFFHASISLNRCQMVAYVCDNWSVYEQGKCFDCGPKKDRCAFMGLRANEFKQFKKDYKSVIMYTKTTGKHPFCVKGTKPRPGCVGLPRTQSRRKRRSL